MRAGALLALVLLLAPAHRAFAEAPVTSPAATSTPCPGAAARDPDAKRGTQVIDLNTADESALLALPGIGPARARAILDYRAAHGPFRSVSQLMRIRGIGRSLLQQLRPLVTLSGVAG